MNQNWFRLNKKPTTLIFIIAIFCVSTWVLYALFGQQLIKMIYEGRSIGMLNRIIEGQTTYPLEFYYKVANQTILSIFLFGLVFVPLLFFSFRTEISARRLLLRIILITIFIFLFVRLLIFITGFAYESLQSDFSAYYTSGEVLNERLSPYLNHVTHSPPIWDGINRFKYGRYLYPPLFGTLFRPLTLFPYSSAKVIWMVFNIFCVIFSLIIAMSIVKLKKTPERILILGIFVCLFHPLLILLERGQISAFTLFVIFLAIKAMLKGGKWQTVSGILFAFSVLLKLHCAFILPFLILRRKWKAVEGYIIGGFLILFASLIFNGMESHLDYITNHFDRICKYGEMGNEDAIAKETRLPEEVFTKYNLPVGTALKGGDLYKTEFFPFVYTANIIGTYSGQKLPALIKKIGIEVNFANLSLIVLVIFFIIMAIWQFYFRRRSVEFTPMQEMVYWQAIMMVILLSAPFTWTTNVVWILPVAVIVLYAYSLIKDKSQASCIYLATMALILAGMPDYKSFPFLLPYGKTFFEYKYVFAEFLLFLSLLAIINKFGVKK